MKRKLIHINNRKPKKEIIRKEQSHRDKLIFKVLNFNGTPTDTSALSKNIVFAIGKCAQTFKIPLQFFLGLSKMENSELEDELWDFHTKKANQIKRKIEDTINYINSA